jgi:hypothetical protein
MNSDNSTPETITIQLTQGQQTVISVIDADLADLKWRAQAQRGGYYAIKWSPGPNYTMVYLHRVILERMVGRILAKTEYTDHISGDRLDNRRENLRIASNAENQRNRGKPSSNTSGHKGVTWHRKSGKWQAQIMINGKSMYLGLFTTPEAAHEAYKAAAVELFGEFWRPN